MPEVPRETSAISALRSTLDAALAAHDKDQAVTSVLAAVRSGTIDIESLYTQVLVPVLVQTGAGWQAGDTQVWQEHLATATVRTIVEGLYPDVVEAARRVPGLGKTAVLACPPGEQHDLGLRMLADRMRLIGWNAHFLGADTPIDQVASAAVAVGAELVALSAATHYNVVLARSVVNELVSLLPDVRVAIGGPGVRCAADWPQEHLLSEESLGLPAADDQACEG